MKKRKVNKKIERNFFSENYKKCWDYLVESRKFIWAIVIIFFSFVAIGFIFQPESISQLIMEMVNELLNKTEDMSYPELTSFIFFNNFKVGFMGVLYGFLFGIPSVLFSLVNGHVVGFVAFFAVSSSGVSSLLSLVPHGIFELPAIFISFGLGFKFGTFWFYKDKMKNFSLFFVESLRVFIFVVVPLLIIAAIIEGTFIHFLG